MAPAATLGTFPGPCRRGLHVEKSHSSTRVLRLAEDLQDEVFRGFVEANRDVSSAELFSCRCRDRAWGSTASCLVLSSLHVDMSTTIRVDQNSAETLPGPRRGGPPLPFHARATSSCLLVTSIARGARLGPCQANVSAQPTAGERMSKPGKDLPGPDFSSGRPPRRKEGRCEGIRQATSILTAAVLACFSGPHAASASACERQRGRDS